MFIVLMNTTMINLQSNKEGDCTQYSIDPSHLEAVASEPQKPFEMSLMVSEQYSGITKSYECQYIASNVQPDDATWYLTGTIPQGVVYLTPMY